MSHHATPTVPPAHPTPPPSEQQPSPAPKRRGGRRGLALALTAVLLVGGGGFALAWGLRGNEGPVAIQSVTLSQSSAAPPTSALAQTVDKVLPSVVNIHSTQIGVSFLGGTQQSKAEGSGVVLSRNGVILTNNHVIANATRVTVSFNDGSHKSLRGTVVGTDPQHDLAIVKVQADDLAPITLGKSSKLQLGDPVAAIGFPLDLGGPTVTQGIISGVDRAIQASDAASGSEHLKGLLQTDAAINPGNSGGALIDGNGHLVGINTAAASASSAENTGFAIPVDQIVPDVKQILSHKSNQKAWLGVEVQSVSSDALARRLGFPPSTRGALIAAVVPASPAAMASLRQGEIIESVNGKDVSAAQDLTSALAGLQAGHKVTLGLLTRTGHKTVPVTLGARPATLQG